MQKGGKGPKGFIVVLPGGIIEIPQDSYLSWLTLFYLMPRVLVEKWPPALEIPRRPFEALRSQKCLDSIKQDKFAELVRDCWSWSAWQFFQVKDSRGNYRDIHGSRDQYSGHFRSGSSHTISCATSATKSSTNTYYFRRSILRCRRMRCPGLPISSFAISSAT